ncbi:MAG: exodeoxyribonuclease VII large subunit [Tenericutes bacterium]|nr:exodeoxyribonuclease VII large subunit [Mycoplasmatota bacterium]
MNSEALSVTDVNTYLKTIMDNDPFLNYVYIKGEISNLKFHTRGHLYFSLKDENSKINAVMFNYKNMNIDFVPEDGMNVLVKGKISVFVNGGSYQITVTNMKQDGIGNLYILFEELKKKLKNEGLFDEEHKKKLPRIPKKIGVITASTGAAVRDIISTINRRFPLAEIILFPSLVQGTGAKENLVKMIETADKSDVDVIILGRGGGSIEDLWAFNEEIVARAVYNAKKPIVSAVGHEIDFTICDFVADLRAPTPTGAAELVVPSKLEIQKYLSDYNSRLLSVITSKISTYKTTLKKLESSYILNNPKSMYEVEEQKLDSILEKLGSLMGHTLEKSKLKLENLTKNITPNILYKLDKNKSHLETLEQKLELLNPENILKKGYSLTIKDGKIITDVSELKDGDTITTKLSIGTINSKVIGGK